ncbi:4679_t:CDS:2 [Racocetra persica]|uniref:4679_t:CDS:1 n=1 Tax=Racocetra persica TaxID=160502 RepID=A0ACA9KBE8_9GLOM|nr:4679_t:CDS:2 [Racocetra persica]
MKTPVEVKSSSEWSKPNDKKSENSKNVGKVEIRTSNDSTSKEINIAQANSIPCMKNAFPEVIPAREISLERQWYL